MWIPPKGQAAQGAVVMAKAPPAVNRECYFSKEGFRLGDEAGSLTCSGGQTVGFDSA